MNTSLLPVLEKLELVIPELLLDEAGWNGLFVNYHPPFVERLWRQLPLYRVYLHLIQPCEPGEALFHPHPWPSAMKVLSGRYEMLRGHGPGNNPPEIAERLVLEPGMSYEMVHPDDWHAVRPINEPAFSLMVTGKPYGRWSPKSEAPLPELSAERRRLILDFFKEHYGVTRRS